jgi:hypothetical protein
MKRSLIALVSLLFVISSGSASAQENVAISDGSVPGSALICAQRYQELSALIEDLGDAPNFGGDKLFNALRAMTRAYRTCARGELSRAMSMYDEAVLRLVFPVAVAR